MAPDAQTLLSSLLHPDNSSKLFIPRQVSPMDLVTRQSGTRQGLKYASHTWMSVGLKTTSKNGWGVLWDNQQQGGCALMERSLWL